MAYRRWYGILLMGLFGSALTMVAVNYLIDPFDVFHSPLFKRQFQQNQRFVKIEFLEAHHSSYNSFLFGSSRVGTTDPEIFDRYVAGARTYNMTVSSGTPLDELEFLRFFIRKGWDVKNVWFQIDMEILLAFYDFPKDDLFRRQHPHVVDESLAFFYLDYLRGLPFLNIKEKLLQNVRSEMNYTFLDVEHGGRWYWPEKDKAMTSDPKRYVAAEPSFHGRVSRTLKATRLDQNLAALRELKRVCAEHGIRLVIFTNPDHRQFLDRFVVEDYLEAMKALADVTDFWNFSSYNSVTEDDQNYYESAHYRPRVAELIAGRIFGGDKLGVPGDFGFQVTRGNVEAYVGTLRAGFTERLTLHRLDAVEKENH